MQPEEGIGVQVDAPVACGNAPRHQIIMGFWLRYTARTCQNCASGGKETPFSHMPRFDSAGMSAKLASVRSCCAGSSPAVLKA